MVAIKDAQLHKTHLKLIWFHFKQLVSNKACGKKGLCVFMLLEG